MAEPARKMKKFLSEEARKRKREKDKERSRTRINIGPAYNRWQDLKQKMSCKNDGDLALILLDFYEEMMATSNPQKGRYSARLPDPAESSIVSGSLSDQDDDSSVADGEEMNTSNSEGASPQQLDASVHRELPLMMSSQNEVEQETCAAPSGQSSENGKTLLLGTRHCLRLKDEATSNSSENKENRDHEEDKDAEFSTSLSVGDGRYLVDLGSSSEFVVDEECILQLFKSCRECSKQCTVRKQVKGLKLVVYQSCHFCQSRCKWTNLPDDDNGDFQINGKAAAHGQAKSAMSPSSNTS